MPERWKISVIFTFGVSLFAWVSVSQALIITSPRNGETFKEGDTVKIVAELSPNNPEDQEIAYVGFFITKGGGDCPDEIDTHPRYECTFTIPSGSPRVIKIGALGKTIESAVASPEVTIAITLPPNIVLQKLKAFTGSSTGSLFFSGVGLSRRLRIDGIYSDGIERELSSGAVGTAYASSNEKVVTVNPEGIVTAKGPGSAEITVKNGKHKLVVGAIVKPRP